MVVPIGSLAKDTVTRRGGSLDLADDVMNWCYYTIVVVVVVAVEEEEEERRMR